MVLLAILSIGLVCCPLSVAIAPTGKRFEAGVYGLFAGPFGVWFALAESKKRR